MNLPRAIVFEDDPKLSTIYVTALQHAGFDVALDMNGDKCKALLSIGEPALVILDIHLPYASGPELLSMIRAQYPKVVVAIVTADLTMAKSLTQKADYVLIKPVSVGRLLKIAESVSASLADSAPAS
jgi:DNA-binding response OmpR family regulator